MANVLKVFLENGQTKSFKYDSTTKVQVCYILLYLYHLHHATLSVIVNLLPKLSSHFYYVLLSKSLVLLRTSVGNFIVE